MHQRFARSRCDIVRNQGLGEDALSAPLEHLAGGKLPREFFGVPWLLGKALFDRKEGSRVPKGWKLAWVVERVEVR
ncbi:MAG: hypothetical protein V3U07_04925 [Nitrospirales bacterium]